MSQQTELKENKLVFKSRIEKFRELTYKPINDSYCQYLDVIKTEVDGKIESITKTHGVTSLSEILGIKGFEHITDRVEVDWMINGGGYITPILKSEFYDMLDSKIHIGGISKNYNTPYDPEKYIYCIFSANNELADLNKEIIITPFHIDYALSYLTDAFYDLDKVLDFIKNDKSNRFLPAKWDSLDEIEILNVPYYNAGDDGYHYIKFDYVPQSKEEAYELTKLSSLDRPSIMVERLFSQFSLN